MLGKKPRRNYSLNGTGTGETSAPARVNRGQPQERSVGAVTLDTKRTLDYPNLRLVAKKDSLKVIARHASKDMVDALFSNEPSTKSYNMLNNKMLEKADFGWKTERTSKEFSIKKNSLDWIHLKERLNTQKVVDNEDKQNTEEVFKRDHKQKVADFLAAIAKIGNDANYWLGEESRGDSLDLKELIRCLREQTSDQKRQSAFGIDRGKAGNSVVQNHSKK